MPRVEMTPVLDETSIARFNKRVKTSDYCWMWMGWKDGNGYGKFRVLDSSTGTVRGTTAHRIAWMIKHGPIEPGLLICHHCDTPGCVRPDHLFAGTQSMNLQDAISKGRFQNLSRGKSLIGGKNPNTSLSADDVTAIKVLSRRGMGPTLIGQIFRVSTNCILRILNGHSWKYHA